jgi:hypothetical protein
MTRLLTQTSRSSESIHHKTLSAGGCASLRPRCYILRIIGLVASFQILVHFGRCLYKVHKINRLMGRTYLTIWPSACLIHSACFICEATLMSFHVLRREGEF